MTGKVEGLFVAPEARMRTTPMEYVLVIPDAGIAGDRYGMDKGSFSNSKRKTIRELSFIAVEDIDEANLNREHSFTPSETRRNILTSGIDLRTLIRKTFKIGAVRFLGIEECTPCILPSELSGKPDFAEAFKGRGGLRAQVLVGGFVTVGDSIIPNKELKS